MGVYATADDVRDNLVKFQDPISAAKLTDPIIEKHLNYVEGKINGWCRQFYVVPFVAPIDPAVTALAVDLTTIRLLRRFFAQTPKRSDLEKDMTDPARQSLKDIIPNTKGMVLMLLDHPIQSTIRQKPNGSYVWTSGWKDSDFAVFGIDTKTHQRHSTNYFNNNTKFGDNPDAVNSILLK